MKVVQARAVLQQMVDAGHGPGLFGLVTQDGRVLFSGGAGVADLGRRRKIREHDRFRVGSVTKTYIAALACLAEEQGCLRLADTAGRWLPEFGLDQELRVEDLLHLRSGLPNYVGALLGEPPRLDAYRRCHRPEDLIRLALSLDGRLTPGSTCRGTEPATPGRDVWLRTIPGQAHRDDQEEQAAADQPPHNAYSARPIIAPHGPSAVCRAASSGSRFAGAVPHRGMRAGDLPGTCRRALNPERRVRLTGQGLPEQAAEAGGILR